jgi:hypothetical protein
MVWPLTREKSDRRLYVDLLFRKEKMYANYTPETYLALGDYGDVTKDGEFIRSGNLFREYPHIEGEAEPRKENATVGNDRHFFVSRSPRKNTFSTLTV